METPNGIPVIVESPQDDGFAPNPFTVDTTVDRSVRMERSFKAEAATAMYLGGVRNITDFAGDGGVDVNFPGGETVDVKSTHYPNGRLLIPAYTWDIHGGIRADYVVFVITPEFTDEVYLMGYVTREMADEAPFVPWNKGPCKKFEQKELRPIRELRALLGSAA